ncbi:hypothetical protein EDB85DRAFT_1897794 [Lactarius pseudohatsudake]|nr:hypothetical protein EDB85DRAFT_1897794 [Lactarius pseudohatsudake]
MSKKTNLPPRDIKTGKFLTKPRQPPSSLATPAPTARKPSQSLASSSALTDEPSSPLVSITSSLPGSFPSSAAASPARQHSPARSYLLPTRPILPPANPTSASLALADSALANLTPAESTPANTAADNSVSANPDTTNLASATNLAPADPTPVIAATDPASLIPADTAPTNPAPTDSVLANTTLPYTRPLFPPARPIFRTTPLAPTQPARPRSSSVPHSLALAPSLPPTLPPAVHFASYRPLALPLVAPLAPSMPSHTVIGPAAMPRPTKAPFFAGLPDEPIADFLGDYGELADGHQLTEKQKVETTLRYIPHSLKDLW